MTSILVSDYIKPVRPYSTNELKDMQENFMKKLNLSNIRAFHKECGHFYYVKENGRKEKELTENLNNVGNCSCCWKLSKTPKDLIDKAEDLVQIYCNNFYEYPSIFTYDLIDLETSFYKWLYMDKYDTIKTKLNKSFKKRYLKINTTNL